MQLWHLRPLGSLIKLQDFSAKGCSGLDWECSQIRAGGLSELISTFLEKEHASLPSLWEEILQGNKSLNEEGLLRKLVLEVDSPLKFQFFVSLAWAHVETGELCSIAWHEALKKVLQKFLSSTKVSKNFVERMDFYLDSLRLLNPKRVLHPLLKHVDLRFPRDVFP